MKSKPTIQGPLPKCIIFVISIPTDHIFCRSIIIFELISDNVSVEVPLSLSFIIDYRVNSNHARTSLLIINRVNVRLTHQTWQRTTSTTNYSTNNQISSVMKLTLSITVHLTPQQKRSILKPLPSWSCFRVVNENKFLRSIGSYYYRCGVGWHLPDLLIAQVIV